jgi:LAS superfamily LD-carboxypeptidase LdcB
MKSLNTNQTEALGLSMDHLTDISSGFGVGCKIHRGVVEPLIALKKAATAAGFDLRVASGFRDFGRQLSIFNAKVRGERAVLDSTGKTQILLSKLSDLAKVEAIMRWSALPGASRHHWGTDVDVYDAAAVADDYQIQLTPAECAGPFAPFHSWLDENLARFGFFRPYRIDRGGIAPERWHLSFAGQASIYQREICPELLAEVLYETDIELKPVIRDNMVQLFRRFIEPIDSPTETE